MGTKFNFETMTLPQSTGISPLNHPHRITTFNIKAPPEILQFTFGDKPMSAGYLVTVPCVVVGGDRPVHVHWLFDGHHVTHRTDMSSQPLGESGAILNIASVGAAHAGLYTCRTRNRAGVAEYSARLHVTGVPLHGSLMDTSFFCCDSFQFAPAFSPSRSASGRSTPTRW
jgi:Immunoglobulin domain